jgi:hypothetical protein
VYLRQRAEYAEFNDVPADNRIAVDTTAEPEKTAIEVEAALEQLIGGSSVARAAASRW